MCRNKILEKLLAIILIFTLTFANFAFVTESLATSLVETLFGSNAETGSKNVEFEAYFGSSEGKETQVVSDVNNEELTINVNLGVYESGYLKDGKIVIAEAEEGAGINFEVKKDFELPELVQNFEDNTFYLRQVDCATEANVFSIPIKYVNEKYVDDANLSKDAKVLFTGVYVDNEGDENEVSREINLNVSWKDERTVRVESEVTKFIDYGSGVILQTLVKVDNTTENENSLPVKSSELTINVPTYDGKVPTGVDVVSNSTQGTNGKLAGDVSFGPDNWSYDEENHTVNIHVENQKESVQVIPHEEEFLRDESTITVEDRYYNIPGVDQYIITYTYADETMGKEQSVNSNVSAKVTMFSGSNVDNNIYVSTVEGDVTYDIVEQVGNVVSLSSENETNEVSKAYMYVNYNHNDRYEIEYKSKTILNISYKDIVKNLIAEDVETFYMLKDGSKVPSNDLRYKEVSISKANFDEILGENGQIRVLDENSNEIVVINKDTAVNEEGNIVVNLENVSKVKFETSAPIVEGNLVINKVRVSNVASIDKATLANAKEIVNSEKISANYAYVNSTVEVANTETVTELKDTSSNAKLVMDRDSLSTLTTNENVELRIELNNAVETSDVFGHSEYRIELPENITNVDVTDYSMAYGEGLTISSLTVDGRVINVVVDGVQDGINSGVLSNGANIKIYANIKADLYTPAKTDKVVLTYANSEATNVENEGRAEVEFNYSAPTGLVAVNSTVNYNNAGTVLASVRQGAKVDMIDIYSEAKVATMEVIIMNNNQNVVNNVSILGRIPFEGVKDIETGEDLGTTVDSKLVSGLVSDERNGAAFNIYYSENGEATKDLNDSSNGWTTEFNENTKSYLIVPVDPNYEMKETDILRFTYQYEIPANLPHNETMYGTFLAYYTNVSDIAVTDEVSAPDPIGLTTGAGPEITPNASAEKTTVKGAEEFKYKVSVENTGKQVAENVEVKVDIPQYAEFVEVLSENENITHTVEDKLVVRIDSLQIGEKLEFEVVYKAQEVTMERNLKIGAVVTAKDLGKEVEVKPITIKIVESQIEVHGFTYDPVHEAEYLQIGDEIDVRFFINNLSDSPVDNVVIKQVLPAETDYVESHIFEGYEDKEVPNGSYDESTRTITWTINRLEAEETINYGYHIKVVSLPEGITDYRVSMIQKVSIPGEENAYESNDLVLKIGRPVIEVVQTSTTTETYVTEGQAIKYLFTIKNTGSVNAENISLVDKIPDGLVVRSIHYTVDGVNVKQRVSSNEQAVVNMTLAPSHESVVEIEALASSLNGVQEKTVTNKGSLSAENNSGEVIETNEITHIIEADANKTNEVVEESNSNVNASKTQSSNSNIVKTYKITGVAWEDGDGDGARQSGETLLPGISVKLVNSDTGTIVRTATTDANGAYTFSGIENGNYLVLFDYDTVRYTVATYQKAGVDSGVNSDAFTTQVDQDGKTRNAAITDVVRIQNGSVSNIDIGLVNAATFDLELKAAITNITVQSRQGTENIDFKDGSTLAKAEIGSKYISGSTVIITYNIKVANKGELKGFAKEIVDYLPEGMEFNSSMDANKNWYTGTDGNLYSTYLANTELAPGQETSFELVLTKQMTEENTGIINNLVEIAKDYNIYGVSDKNSTPANKAQGENDIGSADTIILIRTGEALIYTSVIITTEILGAIVAFMAYTKLVSKKRKGGV